jgi:hypothetical protein
MPDLHLYLPPKMREDAENGAINIINLIGKAVATVGYGLKFNDDTVQDRKRARPGKDLHLFHMQDPTGPHVLNLRRAYTYPFWQIETTNNRWDFDIANAKFKAAAINMTLARPFFKRWRSRILGDDLRSRDGFVFMPLQGRLREHRSFQTMSPQAMIEATLEAEPNRDIRATLHPGETYDDADFAMLETFSARYSRFKAVVGDARMLVRHCDYVVTQNSSVALTGFFAKKPAVLFAGIDFHHIAGSVARAGVTKAFAHTAVQAPFVAYMYWFFKTHMINGGAPDAEAQILARMRAHGWPV